MKRWIALLCLSVCTLCSLSARAADDAAFRRQVDAFVDQWHADAAKADPVYFDKMAPDAVYIGTDKSEVWTREQFRAWAKPFFDRKKAWAFTAIKRNVYWSPDRRYAWFDEQLKTQMGVCQASGVLHHRDGKLEIVHYQLSLAVPNPLMDKFTQAIREFEAAAPR